jgi:hypothetical protein
LSPAANAMMEVLSGHLPMLANQLDLTLQSG